MILYFCECEMKGCSFIGRIETFPFALYHKATLIVCCTQFHTHGLSSPPFDKLKNMCDLLALQFVRYAP